MTFFRSRWVEKPGHVAELDPDALPRCFCASGVVAGLKPDGLDVGVLTSTAGETTSAARFTTNARVGAPVIASKEARLGELRAIVANSGCSNVGDGERGLETAREMQRVVADELDIEPAQVGVASTGVIGIELPRDKVVAGAREACGSLKGDAADFAKAILTTDAGPKRACLEVGLPSGRSVRLSAQAKGVGMLSPRFATMFCFIQTDAALDAETVDLLTGVCVKRSFDRISVDGQLSTSDTVFTIANGASGVRIQPQTPDELALGEAMDALLRQLALDMVHDGEGSERVGRIVVHGDSEAVEPVARSIADSPLVKTALHGSDPNFGRILQAAGKAFPPGAPFIVDLEIEGRQLVCAGDAIDVGPEELAALQRDMQREEVEIVLTLPGEGGETEVFFSDLSEEWVTFNSSYTT